MNPVTLVLIPGHTSYSPGGSAPMPPFKPGFTEYIQASKLCGSIMDFVKALSLPWNIEFIDKSDKVPYQASIKAKKESLVEIGANRDGVKVGIEIHFGTSHAPAKPKVEDVPQDQKGEDGEPKIPISRPGSGIRTMAKTGCVDSELLARKIHGQIVKVIPLPDRGVGTDQKNELLDACPFPIILIRPLFIDGGVDPQFLRFSRSREFIAGAIIQGISQYLEAKKKETKK